MTRYISPLCLTIFVWLAAACSHGEDSLTVSSPNERIAFALSLSDSGQPLYTVSVDGTPLMAPSLLGFEEADGLNMQNGFKVKGSERKAFDETWTQPWGENKEVRNHCNELAVKLENEERVRMTVRIRVFDDGVGFRYECDTPADSLRIMNELTEFCFAQNGKSWSIPANFDTYELVYRTLPIDSVPTANTPFTFKTDGGIYGSIHEAALTDYPEMTLKRSAELSVGSVGAFSAELAPWPDGVKARFDGGTFQTPWRTILIGHRAVDLINSCLTLNLNEPCKIEGDLSWIKPMRYVGVWWSMHLGIESWVMGDRHGATTESAKKYIDFAAKHGIEAVLYEGWNNGWDSWGSRQDFDFTEPFADFDMKAVAAYAKEKGVEIIGHHETGGNIPNYEKQLDKAYEWYADLGVHSVKTGYAGGLPNGHNHHGQYNVRHYRHVVEVAAKNHTTLDVHEPIKDTGIRRTWPNMMTREGARGMEWNAWSEGNMPEHHEMLPFTRLLAGPMDYTPGTFDILFLNTRDHPDRKKWNDQDKGNSRVNTTLCKQLANWVILYSPLQMASDLIEHYEGHPAFRFFEDFDADCDWSEALQGEPGEFVAVVRKAKGKYFLGATTNERARVLSIPCSFLEKGKVYKAIVYADADDANWKTNPTAYVIREQRVTQNSIITAHLAPGGGQAITFLPE